MGGKARAAGEGGGRTVRAPVDKAGYGLIETIRVREERISFSRPRAAVRGHRRRRAAGGGAGWPGERDGARAAVARAAGGDHRVRAAPAVSPQDHRAGLLHGCGQGGGSGGGRRRAAPHPGGVGRRGDRLDCVLVGWRCVARAGARARYPAWDRTGASTRARAARGARPLPGAGASRKEPVSHERGAGHRADRVARRSDRARRSAHRRAGSARALDCGSRGCGFNSRQPPSPSSKVRPVSTCVTGAWRQTSRRSACEVGAGLHDRYAHLSQQP